MAKPIQLKLLVFILGILANVSIAQNVDIEALTKAEVTALKITGGISSNAVYYSSNKRNARKPFTYFFQGNLNISWLTFSMPLSYSFSNQGSNLSYQVPFKFNRLSLHPKYKWIQAHIGEVTMSFSPYTLNGHQSHQLILLVINNL